MVGAINPNITQTPEGQTAAARTVQFGYPPGGDVPKEGGSENHSSRLSAGAVVGLAVGGGAFLGICAALFFFVGRAKELKEIVKRSDEGSMMKPVGVGVGRHADFGVMDHRQSTFLQPQRRYSQSQAGYAQDFESLSPAYTSLQLSKTHLGDRGGGYDR
jgi:hypothetical protein